MYKFLLWVTGIISPSVFMQVFLPFDVPCSSNIVLQLILLHFCFKLFENNYYSLNKFTLLSDFLIYFNINPEMSNNLSSFTCNTINFVYCCSHLALKRKPVFRNKSLCCLVRDFFLLVIPWVGAANSDFACTTSPFCTAQCNTLALSVINMLFGSV